MIYDRNLSGTGNEIFVTKSRRFGWVLWLRCGPWSKPQKWYPTRRLAEAGVRRTQRRFDRLGI